MHHARRVTRGVGTRRPIKGHQIGRRRDVTGSTMSLPEGGLDDLGGQQRDGDHEVAAQCEQAGAPGAARGCVVLAHGAEHAADVAAMRVVEDGIADGAVQGVKDRGSRDQLLLSGVSRRARPWRASH